MRAFTVQNLYSLYISRAGQLLSDGDIVENGNIRISTKSGATLKIEAVISALKKRDERKPEEIKAREEKNALRDLRKLERRGMAFIG